MKPLLTAGLGLLLLAAPAATAQDAARVRYADVRVSAPGEAGRGVLRSLAARLAAAGVGLDHAAPEKTADGALALRAVFSDADVAAARAAGLRVDVLDADLAATAAGRAARGGCPASPYPVTGSMGCYPTFAEAVDILDQMRAEFPALVSARTAIGTTAQGRAVWMVELGDNPGVDEGEPEVLFTALHHAREPQGLATVLYTMWDLLRRGDAEAQFLLANRRLFVVPVLNPDGYVHNQTTDPAGGGLWRKNRRANAGGSVGVDLNRNYGFEWGHDDVGSSPSGGSETYRGPAAFSEPETAALRDFVASRRIRVAFNYHAFGNLLIHPWGYEADLYTPDSAAFVDAARVMTAGNGYRAGTGNQTVGYLVNGSSDDWMYGDTASGRPATLAYTPEVGARGSDGFWPDPSRIVPIAEENVAMNRYALRIAGGTLAVARVRVEDDGGNGFVDPGETARVTVVLTNGGRTDVSSDLVRLVATGPGVTTDGGTVAATPTLAPGDTVAVGPFLVAIGDAVALGSLDALAVEVALGGGLTATLPLPALTIGTPETLVADDATTLAGWTASGGWGRSTSVFVSPPSAFADSPAGDYTDNTDRTLTRVAAIALAGSGPVRLRFNVRYETEPGYDAATVEAQAGAGPWTALAGRLTAPSTSEAVEAGVPVGTPVYSGTQTAWQPEEMSLAAFAGQSVRLRFRLRSDGVVAGDGIYVDDLAVVRLVDGGAVAGEAGAVPEAAVALGVPAPNPARGRVRLAVTLAAAGDARVTVVDALGRQVAVLLDGAVGAGRTDVSWDAARAAPGVYVVRLRAATGEASRRVVVR